MKAKTLRKYTTESKTIPNFSRICGRMYNVCTQKREKPKGRVSIKRHSVFSVFSVWNRPAFAQDSASPSSSLTHSLTHSLLISPMA